MGLRLTENTVSTVSAVITDKTLWHTTALATASMLLTGHCLARTFPARSPLGVLCISERSGHRPKAIDDVVALSFVLFGAERVAYDFVGWQKHVVGNLPALPSILLVSKLVDDTLNAADDIVALFVVLLGLESVHDNFINLRKQLLCGMRRWINRTRTRKPLKMLNRIHC
jgi:hypothetical protein